MQASKHQKYMSDCFSSNICSSSSSSWCWYVRRSMFPLRRAPGSSGLLIRAAAIIENPFQHPTNTNQWFLTTEMQSWENTFWTAGFWTCLKKCEKCNSMSNSTVSASNQHQSMISHRRNAELGKHFLDSRILNVWLFLKRCEKCNFMSNSFCVIKHTMGYYQRYDAKEITTMIHLLLDVLDLQGDSLQL